MTSALLSTQSIPEIASGCQYNFTERGLDNSHRRSVRVQPPDKGWGWAVVFAAFLCSAIVDGLVFSFPCVFGLLLDDVGTSYWIALICAAVQVFSYLVVGPFVSKYLGQNTCRRFVCCGSILATAGFLASAAIANELKSDLYYIIILSLGLAAGCGLGCVYISSVCAVSCYFVRHRVAATTIALSGSGVGMTVFPPLIAYFTKTLDFYECMIYFAGISLQTLFLGCFIWPLSELPPGCDPQAGRLPREKDIFDYIRERVGYPKNAGSRDSEIPDELCQARLQQAKQRRLIQLRLESECDPVARMDSDRSGDSPVPSTNNVNAVSPIRHFLNRQLKRRFSRSNSDNPSESPSLMSGPATPVLGIPKTAAGITTSSTEVNAIAIGSNQGISMRRQSTVPDQIFSQLSQMSQPPADITSYVGGASIMENISVITDVGRRLDECQDEVSEFVLILDPQAATNGPVKEPRNKSVSECVARSPSSNGEPILSRGSSTTTDVPRSQSSDEMSDESKLRKTSESEHVNGNSKRGSSTDQDNGKFAQDDIMALIMEEQAAMQENVVLVNGEENGGIADGEKSAEGTAAVNVQNDTGSGEVSNVVSKRLYRRQSSSSNRVAFLRQRSLQKSEQRVAEALKAEASRLETATGTDERRLANGKMPDVQTNSSRKAESQSAPALKPGVFSNGVRFPILCLANAVAMAGLFVPLLFFPLRIIWVNGLEASLFSTTAEDLVSIARLQAGFLISVAGSAGCIARIAVVIGSEVRRSNPLFITAVGFLVQSLLVVLSTFVADFALLAILLGCIAACTELFVSMTTSIIRWSFTPDGQVKEKCDSGLVNKAFSVLTVIRAVSAIVGVLFSGYIFSTTDPYGSCFLVIPNSPLRPFRIDLPSDSDMCNTAFSNIMYYAGATLFASFLIHAALFAGCYARKFINKEFDKNSASNGTLLLQKIEPELPSKDEEK